jgi:hypothetical protein
MESSARVHDEIQQHYELSREEAMRDGASDAEADQIALLSLGEAKVANRQYRKVLLTASEAETLRLNRNADLSFSCWPRRGLFGPVVLMLLMSVPLMTRHVDQSAEQTLIQISVCPWRSSGSCRRSDNQKTTLHPYGSNGFSFLEMDLVRGHIRNRLGIRHFLADRLGPDGMEGMETDVPS